MRTLADLQKSIELLWKQGGYEDPYLVAVDTPTLAQRTTIITSVEELDILGVAVGSNWMCMTAGKYYRRFLKLVSSQSPVMSGIAGVISDQGFAHSWTLVTTLGEIFATPQPYTVAFESTKGPKGDTGDGIKGPPGDPSGGYELPITNPYYQDVIIPEAVIAVQIALSAP